MKKIYAVAIISLLIAANSQAALRKSTINDVLGTIIALGYKVGMMDNIVQGKVPEGMKNEESMKAIYSLDYPTRIYFSDMALRPMKKQLFALARKLMDDLKGSGYLTADLEDIDIDNLESFLYEMESLDL